nr:hypothetical protein CFP56_72337 [Quercus suber]
MIDSTCDEIAALAPGFINLPSFLQRISEAVLWSSLFRLSNPALFFHTSNTDTTHSLTHLRSPVLTIRNHRH